MEREGHRVTEDSGSSLNAKQAYSKETRFRSAETLSTIMHIPLTLLPPFLERYFYPCALRHNAGVDHLGTQPIMSGRTRPDQTQASFSYALVGCL